MGIINMQGTSAHIEYIGERKVKKYSCKNCFNYVDGVCRIKNIDIDYSNGNGKHCSSFEAIDNFKNPKCDIKETDHVGITIYRDSFQAKNAIESLK